jgi:hypothetical protein
VLEAVGEVLESVAHDGVPLSEVRRSEASMDVRWSEHCDSRMPVLGIVMGHKRPREILRVLKEAEAGRWEIGGILHGLVLRLGRGIVVADVRTAMRSRSSKALGSWQTGRAPIEVVLLACLALGLLGKVFWGSLQSIDRALGSKLDGRPPAALARDP